ncbi:MAG: right-handed parallel beta-helix repeat-containing protein [Devosia sp.]|nr:right-handed parallel beta-helix repeat-containing protein [Devosia sp.]
MATTYYVDSATGSDSNAGTSESAALQSMAAVEALKLSPGDTVLFARGTSYDSGLVVKYSGSADNPITFGAYGVGDAPVIGNSATGIYGSKTQNIVVQDLTIAHTTGNAIFALNATNWTVAHVTVLDTGTTATSGAISFENGTNITIRDSTISGVTGDGIWIDGGKGIVIQNNQIGTVVGHDADNIQVGNASSVSILGNHLDMSGITDSTKGNLVVNTSEGVVIESNVMVGGSYGASVNSNDVTIAYNEIYGQSGYKWSFGIGIGETWSVKNYDIFSNSIHDVNFGVAVTGRGDYAVTRTNVDVHDNTFDNISGAALKVDRPATGEFIDNEIGSNSPATRISSDVAAAGTFAVGDNQTFDSTGPQAVADAVTAGGHAVAVAGSLLANDVGSGIVLSAFAGEAIGHGLEIAGKYGTVYVNEDGTFSYVVNESAASGITKPTQDIFSYLITEGDQQSEGHLTVNLASRLEVAPVGVNDRVDVASDGTANGSVLGNDTDQNADVLYVRSVNGERVSGTSAVEVAGQYGTLTITADGHFSYAVDPAKVVGSSDALLHESFVYKISDSIMQDTASLGVYIDPTSLVAHTNEAVI